MNNSPTRSTPASLGSRTKVFGIGFQKTGTTSLGRALELLGYRMHGVFGFLDPDIAENALPQAIELAQTHDAFQDNPWSVLYQELDAEFPGSKFILTERPTDQWIESVVRHFGTRSEPMREWIYGDGRPRGNEQLYVDRYERHNREVRAYFQDRPDDLLIMNVTNGEGWETLCPFLGIDVPKQAFPHRNSTSERRMQRFRRYVNRPIESISKLVKAYANRF